MCNASEERAAQDKRINGGVVTYVDGCFGSLLCSSSSSRRAASTMWSSGSASGALQNRSAPLCPKNGHSSLARHAVGSTLTIATCKSPQTKQKNWEELTRKFRDCKAVPSVHPAIHISIRISIQKGNPIPLHSIICIDNQLQSASYTYQSWQYQSEWTSPMLRTHYVKFNRKIPQLQQRKRQR